MNAVAVGRAHWRGGSTLLLLLGALALGACGRQSAAPTAEATKDADAANVLSVLAGSELKELEPALKQAAREVDIELQLKYAGTLEMADRVNMGERFDALLPANGAYLALALQRSALAKEKLFYSRVALGVKHAKAQALGWDRKPPTWAQITTAIKAGQLTYAMTNPTSSNTGMSALFAVAASRAGKTEDLTLQDIDRPTLSTFLSGQKLTAGSSGWLADAYLREQGRLDGLVNYEAVLLRLNQRAELADKLDILYPQDGVISADYPLLLLQEPKRAAYVRLVAALRSRAFQAGPVAAAFLRPSNSDAALRAELSRESVPELSFPNNLAVIDAVLSAYQGDLRRPSASIFLLDVSGSMEGQRLAALQSALQYLTGAAEQTATARYARFQNRERVILLPFAGAPGDPLRVEFADQGPHTAEFARIHAFADTLKADGGTAIFSALAQAYRLAAEELRRDPQRMVSVVLLTDGENREGLSLAELQDSLHGQPWVRTFPILFGDANSGELEEVARRSGGRTFDGRKASLVAVFREIRGYQ